MKGLILKDFYLIKSVIAVYLILGVLMDASAVMVSLFDNGDTNLIYLYPMLLSGMIPVFILNYEEKYKWVLFADTLPQSRAKAVSARYTLAAVICGIFLIISAVSLGITTFIFKYSTYECFLTNMTIALAVGLIPPTFALPAQYKFGAGKSKIFNTILICIIAMCAGIFLGFAEGATYDGYMSIPPYLCLIVIAAVAALFLLSWLLSVHIYKRRELKQ